MIGSLESKTYSPEASKPTTAATTTDGTPKTPPAVVTPVTATAASIPETKVEALEPFGELIPFGDPSWYHGVCILLHLVAITP